MVCLSSFIVLIQKEDLYLGVQIWIFGFLLKELMCGRQLET